MIVLLMLLGCGPGNSSSTSGVVECRGLTHTKLSWRMLRSNLLSYDPETNYATPRCEIALSSDLTGGDVQMGIAKPSDLIEGTDRGWGFLYANDQRWRIDSGTLSFDTFDDTLASGAYVFDGVPIDANNNVTGEIATFEGPFSWCAGLREDCPFRFESSLPGKATVDSPVMGSGEGGVTSCRMLVDPANGALQVDLQLGIWEDQNVAQIWVAECGAYGLNPPQNNLFRFQAGGVTGPGSYGPQITGPAGDQQLPNLNWTHPSVWYPGINQTQACALFYYAPATVTNSSGSSCSFTVDDQAGRFDLSCTDVWHQGPGGWPSNGGDFSISADCDYVER